MTAPTPTSTEREALEALLTSVEIATDEHGDGATLAEGPARRLADALLAHYAAHDADLVQRTREQVAAEIEVERDRLDLMPHDDDWQRVKFGFTRCASLAREGGAR